jgi:hypothetical protein
MATSKTLTINDDSGFLAIANSDNYKSFVGENWEYHQLIKHFIDQMNNNNLIIWATGLENKWTINFSDRQSNNKSFREFSKGIRVTNGQLSLTNYEDLTMAAQFEDAKIPAYHNKDLFVQVENGSYNIIVRQLFDSSKSEISDSADFEVVIQKVNTANSEQIDKVFWLTE